MAKQPGLDFQSAKGGLGELKRRLLFVIGALIVFRIGSFIPIPGIDATVLAKLLEQQRGTIIEMFNMFSGGALSRASIFALGIMPYISASIIIQLLTVVHPALAEIKKEGEAGRRKISHDYNSVMQVPRVEKITLNMGVGEAIADKKLLDNAAADLAAISGQKPLITKARKSVAGFKIRQGYPIGCKVTLRGERMWEFFERLISIAVPRIRDFRGLSAKSFDGRGNYSMGVREQIIFPEIDYDKVDRVRGLDITITTTAKSDDEGRALLAAFNFPFRK